MWEFIKVQIGSILGSLADFLVTILLTELGLSWYLFSNIAGNCTGGVIQFTLGRRWIFKNSKTSISVQTIKYIAFFLGNIILSSAGIYLFAHYFQINYIISKLICSVLLGVSYNYFVQKYFVFSVNR
jgi:putative flippase GtrA